MLLFIKKLADCETKQSDKKNGNYIVKKKWNTCFHRWWTTDSNDIEVRANSNPSCYHTYTRIPKKYINNIYFVYVNSKTSIQLNLSSKDLIVGSYEPQKSGVFYNYAFLIFTENSEAISVEEREGDGEIYIKKSETVHKFNMHLLCPAHLHVRSYVPCLNNAETRTEGTRPTRRRK